MLKHKRKLRDNGQLMFMVKCWTTNSVNIMELIVGRFGWKSLGFSKNSLLLLLQEKKTTNECVLHFNIIIFVFSGLLEITALVTLQVFPVIFTCLSNFPSIIVWSSQSEFQTELIWHIFLVHPEFWGWY